MAQTTSGNGQETTPGADAATAQQLIVNAQYIKDLSFENPRAPHSLTQQSSAPTVDINVDVNAQNLNPEAYEVVLTVDQGMPHQQPRRDRKLALILIRSRTNQIHDLLPLVEDIRDALQTINPAEIVSIPAQA